jgi:HAMP domain-containing protein
MALQQVRPDTLDSHQLSNILTALKAGDFSQRLPDGHGGVAGEIADTLNTLLDRLNVFASEMNRITGEVTIGKFGGQAVETGLSGTWTELMDNLNVMSATLTCQVRNFARVTDEIVKGNLSLKVTVDAQGETRELKESLNALVDQLHERQSQHSPGR